MLSTFLLSVRPLAVLVISTLVACSGSSASVPGDDANEQDITGATSNTAFSLQFVDHYVGGAGSKVTLTLDKAGTFTIDDHGVVTRGTFRAGKAKQLPVEYTLASPGKTATGVVKAFDGVLTLTKDGATVALKQKQHRLSDEELCDGSGGHWTDDEVNPKTGLYCTCGGRLFIPSAGGCVAR